MNLAMFQPASGMQPFTAAQLEACCKFAAIWRTRVSGHVRYGHDEVVSEGFVKCDHVRHLVHRYEKATIHKAVLDALEYGTSSPRPYQLGQACDGSITECVLALLGRWCRDSKYCANTLYRAVYQREQTP